MIENYEQNKNDKSIVKNEDEKLSWLSLKPHLKNLRIGGFYQLDPRWIQLIKKSPKRYYLHQIYERFCLFVPVLYTLQEIMYMYEVRRDINKVVDSMFLMLSFTDMIVKQIMLWLRSDIIEENLEIMKGPLFNHDDESHHETLKATAKRSKLALRIFNSMTFATTLLWTMFPLIDYLNGKIVDFAIWLPFNSNVSPRFYLVLLYVWMQTSLLGFNNSTMDMFVSFFYVQCTVQLSILRIQLKNIVERSKMKAIKESITFNEALDQSFNKLIMHYIEIVRYTKNIQKIFGGSLLFQFLVTEWIICTTAYRAINMNMLSLEFLSMVFYLTCVVIEIFLFCYCGTQVHFQSARLNQSAYQMNWLETPITHRRSLIIFMEITKRPIEPVGAINVPLSLNTFIAIVRASYTFYTFLKTTDH